MKKVIFSAAILFCALTGDAQNDFSRQQARYEFATRTFTNASSSLNDKTPVSKVIADAPDSITMRVLRDTEGQVVKTLRYYTAIDILPLHIVSRLTKRFPDYTPTAIIENHDVTGVAYIINLSKGSEWLQAHVSSKGKISIHGRYHNSLWNSSYEGYTSTLP